MILRFLEDTILSSKELNSIISQENHSQQIKQNISREIKLDNQKEFITVEKLKNHELDMNGDGDQSTEDLSSDEKEKQEFLEEKSNIIEIMKIRLNNALAQADKKEKQQCEIDFKKLDNSVFDQEIGYIVSELLNSTIRVVSKDILIISYEYDSVVNQNLKEIGLFQEVLEKVTGISKKIGIITDEMWELEKQKYIKSTKNNQKYDIIEEPELIEIGVDEQSSSFTELNDFGDIVEIN